MPLALYGTSPLAFFLSHRPFSVPRYPSSGLKIPSTFYDDVPYIQLEDHELASGDWGEGEVSFPL
jgi:hypothetical protein